MLAFEIIISSRVIIYYVRHQYTLVGMMTHKELPAAQHQPPVFVVVEVVAATMVIWYHTPYHITERVC